MVTGHARPGTKLEVGEPPPGALVVTGLAAESPTRGSRPKRVAARESEAPKREAASWEKRLVAFDAEAGRARATHTQALDDRKEKIVSRKAQEDGIAQAPDTEREKQAALMRAEVVALAEADAKTAEAVERATEEASAAGEAVVAQQRRIVGELEAEHARALQVAEPTAKARWRNLCDACAEERGAHDCCPSWCRGTWAGGR